VNIWTTPFLRYSNVIQGMFHKVVVLCEADGDCLWYASVASHIASEIGVDDQEILFIPGGGKDQIPGSMAALRSLNVDAFAIVDFDSLFEIQFMTKLIKAAGISDEALLSDVRSFIRSSQNDHFEANARKMGITGVSPGTATQLAKSVLGRLKANGILVVPVGALEDFDRTHGGKGTAWVSSALAANAHESNLEAKDLIKPIVQRLRAG
jgi:hypothetical protein